MYRRGCLGQLTRLGIPGPLAEAVADHVDWHQIAALIRPASPWASSLARS